ncbi:MAG: hypothetical protein IPL84_06230 [Chitinophagaceae bacterium]|nr:hypothetical protein [Chitinophagaceae bacterium]
MQNKKHWLMIKAGLIVLFTLIIFFMPTDDQFRKWFRFIMLTFFVISFIIDLNKYRKDNG